MNWEEPQLPHGGFHTLPSGGWWLGCEWAAAVSTYMILIIAYTVFSPVAVEVDELRSFKVYVRNLDAFPT